MLFYYKENIELGNVIIVHVENYKKIANLYKLYQIMMSFIIIW